MPQPRAMPAPRSISLIEDDEPLADLLRYNFEAAGFAVMWIGDGSAALARIMAEPPDIVVLDWMLPGLSGIEILRRLRQAEATRTVPVLMLTGCITPQERARALSTGADFFIAKPFSVREVMIALQALSRRCSDGRWACAPCEPLCHRPDMSGK